MTRYRPTGTRYSKESQLLKPVALYARREGFRLQMEELPFYEYRIDLYGFSRSKNSTIAIELKLHDWRRALEQAMLYQLCADLVYIALPLGPAKRVDLDELRERGVGLFAVTDTGMCSCVLPAAQHVELREFYRRLQIDYLKESRNAKR
jgi:hypothetical protein